MSKPGNTYSGNSDVLGNGLDELMAEGDRFAELPLSQILVDPQVREELEDEESTLAEMEASIRQHGVFQPVLVRPINGASRPFKLVAGERRYVGSERAEKLTIPALIREMTDAEAEDLQLAENIQRKNLTQIEEAKRIQRDLDRLGSVEAVLEKHSKGRAWLSKILSLLTLPKQAKRLMTEKISSDVEVINKVKTIEHINPQAAEELVNELKASRGKIDARRRANAVKEAVKPLSRPGRRTRLAPVEPTRSVSAPSAAPTVSSETGPVKRATSDGSQANPSNVTQVDDSPGVPSEPTEALVHAYKQIVENNTHPRAVLDAMSDETQAELDAWLAEYFDAGLSGKDFAHSVVQALLDGKLSARGEKVFALIAFLHGGDGTVTRFDVATVFGSAKGLKVPS